MSCEVGQEVAIDIGRYGGKHYLIGEVKKITPSGQIVVRTSGGEYRFRSNGEPFGGDMFYSPRLVALTADVREAARYQELLRRIVGIKWQEQPLAVLERVVAALDGK